MKQATKEKVFVWVTMQVAEDEEIKRFQIQDHPDLMVCVCV
jgi:hypothetical protein